MPEFPAELLSSLLKADTTSRASNADILSFFSKTPLLIDRLRYIRESYKVVFTELLLDDDTRVGFYKESNGLLVWQGSYLTRSAESHLSWHSVTAAISALVDNHELIAAIDPKKAVSQDEQLSFDLPENASRGDEVGALEMSYMKQHFREPHFFIESAEGNDYFRVTPKVYDNLMGKPKKKPSREQGER